MSETVEERVRRETIEECAKACEAEAEALLRSFPDETFAITAMRGMAVWLRDQERRKATPT